MSLEYTATPCTICIATDTDGDSAVALQLPNGTYLFSAESALLLAERLTDAGKAIRGLGNADMGNPQ